MTTEDNTPAANGNQPSTVPHRSHRRAEPITKRVPKNGTLAYKFRAALSTKPDGRRDRRRFTCRTLPEARKELRPHHDRGHSGHLRQVVDHDRGPGVRPVAG